MIESLPDVLIQEVLSQCDYQSMLNLAMMSRRLRDAVEAFCGNKLDEMREIHQVDQSWNYRLGMEANLPQGLHHPAVLSNRHMFVVARRTHLYSFGGRDCPRGVYHLALSPDGSTLVSNGGGERAVRMWDLRTQRCIRSFGGQVLGHLYSLHFCEGFIVTRDSNQSLRIWSVDGSLLHTINPGRINATATMSNQCIFHCNGELSAIDIPSGVRTLNVQQPWSADTAFDSTLLIAGEWLVLMCELFCDDNGQAEQADQDQAKQESGIYVLNRSNLLQESFVQGTFHSIKGNEDGSCIVATEYDEGVVSVFAIDNGRIGRVHYFSSHQFLGEPDTYSILMVSGTMMFLAAHRRRGDIHVVDGKSGIRVRSLRYSPRDCFTGTRIFPNAMVSNGHELLCCFNVVGEVGDVTQRYMAPIKAYPV